MATMMLKTAAQAWNAGTTLTFQIQRGNVLKTAFVRVFGTVTTGGAAPTVRNHYPAGLIDSVRVRSDRESPFEGTGIWGREAADYDGLQSWTVGETPTAAGTAYPVEFLMPIPFVINELSAISLAGQAFAYDTRRLGDLAVEVRCGTLGDLGTNFASANLQVEVIYELDATRLSVEELKKLTKLRLRTYQTFDFTTDTEIEAGKEGLLRRAWILAQDTNGDLAEGIVGEFRFAYAGSHIPIIGDFDSLAAATRHEAVTPIRPGVLLLDFDRFGILESGSLLDLSRVSARLSFAHNANGTITVVWERITAVT